MSWMDYLLIWILVAIVVVTVLLISCAINIRR